MFTARSGFLRALAFAACAAVLLSSRVTAQSVTGTISGTITDAQ